MSTDVTVGGQTYRVGRLDAMKQFHVARKLAPVITTLGGMSDVVRSLKGGEAAGGIELASLRPVMDALASMPEADCEFILGTCLAAVQRKSDGGTGWTPIWNAGAKRLQFEDIGLTGMLEITAAVLRSNLGNFFPAAPSA